MTTYFISRHQGAKDWARLQNIEVDIVQSHLEMRDIKTGDTVIGTLPVNLVAELCQRGARYYHLTLNLPENLRGKELSSEDMIQAGAEIQHFTAEKII